MYEGKQYMSLQFLTLIAEQGDSLLTRCNSVSVPFMFQRMLN
jgi:hypothetical protein